MTENTYFQINRHKFVHETMEDEVVMVNLDSGIYYSLDSSSIWVWRAILAGYSLTEIIQFGKSKFDVSDEELLRALNTFLDKMKEEGIVVTASSPWKEAEIPPSGDDTPKSPFTPPRLELYSDMQDLLLLDPIHDVDESGWPNAANRN